MSRHGKSWTRPIDLDWEGEWDGVVQFDYGRQCFVRYLDRNGEHVEEIRA